MDSVPLSQFNCCYNQEPWTHFLSSDSSTELKLEFTETPQLQCQQNSKKGSDQECIQDSTRATHASNGGDYSDQSGYYLPRYLCESVDEHGPGHCYESWGDSNEKVHLKPVGEEVRQGNTMEDNIMIPYGTAVSCHSSNMDASSSNSFDFEASDDVGMPPKDWTGDCLMFQTEYGGAPPENNNPQFNDDMDLCWPTAVPLSSCKMNAHSEMSESSTETIGFLGTVFGGDEHPCTSPESTLDSTAATIHGHLDPGRAGDNIYELKTRRKHALGLIKKAYSARRIANAAKEVAHQKAMKATEAVFKAQCALDYALEKSRESYLDCCIIKN
ncbi:hypothetical protein R1flu_005022 [Riccia fluitans]|uniref:Uncharacterized protein n=1 Tax=Riccia fluitans TaxID=41844 RepID=A0ABD1YRZ0_9MARC